jgi:hydrogenase expression/formation protein HypE
VMACRHQLGGEGLRSDCAPLAALAELVLKACGEVHAMHDPTRGGLATTCHEVASRAGVRVVLEQAAIPVRPQVRSVCELLGLDPLYVACEGRIVLFLPDGDAERVVKALNGHPLGQGAVRVGSVAAAQAGGAPVVLRTLYNTERPLDLLAGSELPRIC